MILPNSNTGNRRIDEMFQLIDEKLSELYSIHGEKVSRGKQRTSSTTGSSIEGDNTNPVILDTENKGITIGTENLGKFFVPKQNTFYRDMIPRGWGFIASPTGAVVSGFNIVTTKLGTGAYDLQLLQRLRISPVDATLGGDGDNHALSLSIEGATVTATTVPLITYTVNSPGWTVETWQMDLVANTIVHASYQWSVIVFGIQDSD